jgi:hypothetical protein
LELDPDAPRFVPNSIEHRNKHDSHASGILITCVADPNPADPDVLDLPDPDPLVKVRYEYDHQAKIVIKKP